MRGYDEYDTAPADQPDHTALETAITTAGPATTCDPALDAAYAGIDLTEIPF